MGSQCSKPSTVALKSEPSIVASDPKKELGPTALCAQMKATVATGTRHPHIFRRYKTCFSGLEAVDWMLEHEQARSVDEAVRKGQTLFTQGLIEKVDGEATFENSKGCLYRFTSSGPQGCLPRTPDSSGAQ